MLPGYFLNLGRRYSGLRSTPAPPPQSTSTTQRAAASTSRSWGPCWVCGKTVATEHKYASCSRCDAGPTHKDCAGETWHKCPVQGAHVQWEAKQSPATGHTQSGFNDMDDLSGFDEPDDIVPEAASSSASASAAGGPRVTCALSVRRRFESLRKGVPSSGLLYAGDSGTGIEPRLKAPKVQPSIRGSPEAVAAAESSMVELSLAIDTYEAAKFAASSHGCKESRLRWWSERAARAVPRPFDPYPLTSAKLRHALALMKLGGYRSTALYVSAWRNEHIRLGHVWTPELSLEIREGMNSVNRGLGAPTKCPGLDLQQLAELDMEAHDPVEHPSGPVGARDAALVGAWWALRELELGAAKLGALKLRPDPQGGTCGTASFNLPVSKADPAGVGKTRTHGCSCSQSVALCPVAAATRVYNAAAASARKHAGTQSTLTMPLFPTPKGTFPTKDGSIAVFQQLATCLGVSEHVTGHVLRVTGAQTMARAGMDLWEIQMFCRWGSSAILGYVRDVPMENSPQIATRVAGGLTKGEAMRQLTDALNTRSSKVPLSSSRMQQTVETILERQLSSRESRLEEILKALSTKVESLSVEVAAVVEAYDNDVTALPEATTYVVLHSGTQHAIGPDDGTTRCGLTWRSDEVLYTTETNEWHLCENACRQWFVVSESG